MERKVGVSKRIQRTRVYAIAPPALDTEAAENNMTNVIKFILLTVSVGSGLHSPHNRSHTRYVPWPTVLVNGCEVKCCRLTNHIFISHKTVAADSTSEILI